MAKQAQNKVRNDRRHLENITMVLSTPCESAILHEFMERSQGLMVSMFERLGGLMQMLGNDKKLLSMVKLWNETNMEIAKRQLAEIALRREAVELQFGSELHKPKLNIPKQWELSFEVLHPICHQMIKVISLVNEEIKANEELFFAGVMDEEGLSRIKREAVSVMSGVIDRIAKATSPGKRQPKGDDSKSVYSPAMLAGYIRKGFRLDFADVPSSLVQLIAEYEANTSEFKTTVVRENDKTHEVAQTEAVA